MLAYSQAIPQEFDVATIKPSAPEATGTQFFFNKGGGFTATNISVRDLLQQGYDVRGFQITGEPAWARTEKWDISAKVEGLPPMTDIAQLRPLLRALLADRFQLKVHSATKEMPLFSLVVAKAGPKLTANSGKPGPRVGVSAGRITTTKVSLSDFIGLLSRMVGRPVIDRTGLTGVYDITLIWSPDARAKVHPPGAEPDTAALEDPSGPSIFTAIQEQLGLRLESTKGLAEMLVIDAVEKPSAN
jgi:uncharacterized protein (TIGR03435 family)